jgi:hypothetical protein
MAKQKHKREAKGKKINPTFFIVCEGESEETYIRHVRTQYRIPVEIVPKITRNQVSERKIRESIKNSPRHEKDKIYLMYDIDVTGFLSKLETIQKQIKSELIVSNRCFELWYILHFMSQTAEINTDDCIKFWELVREYSFSAGFDMIIIQRDIMQNPEMTNRIEKLMNGKVFNNAA